MNASTSFCTTFLEPIEYETYLQHILSAPGGWNETVWVCQKEICPTLLGGVDNDIAVTGVSPFPKGGLRISGPRQEERDSIANILFALLKNR